MKILLIHQYYLEKGDGGGSRFNEMAKVWAECGQSITVVSGMVHYTTGKKYPRFKGKFISKEQVSNNITVFRCHVSEAYNTNFVGRLWAYFSFVFSSLVCTLTLRERFDLVLVTSPPLFVAISGMITAKIKKIPFVFEVRDLWPESAIDTGVLTNNVLIKAAFWLEKKTYQKAKLINTLTPAFQKRIIEDKLVDASKVIMIPNAADFSISDKVLLQCNRFELRSKLGIDDYFVIIYVGAHGIANHLEQLIDAAEMLTDTKAHFLLIGDGMRKKYLQESVASKKLNNVQMLDPVSKEEIFEYIFAADAGASVLKKVDTFKTVYSNKTFDYMACKKPVLMAIDGVSRELVDTAKCGVYVEPENPHDFAAKVRMYIADPDAALQHGTNGYEYAKTHFDRRILAEKYLCELKCIV